VLLHIGHPAHVHVFKHVIEALNDDRHAVLVTAMDKDVSIRLLGEYGIPYVSVGRSGHSLLHKSFAFASSVVRLAALTRRFLPDVLVGISPVRVAPVAYLCRRPCIGLDDTEQAQLAHRLYLPFVTHVLTPECFRLDMGKKQSRYAGYHELAYLHPRYFTPDPSVLGTAGLDEKTPFSLVRFVSWQATHDLGQHGFSREGRIQLVRRLAQHGRVLISAENSIDPELAEFCFGAPAGSLHHFLYYASVCVTEGGTMAAEAALLGTPAIYMNTLRAGLQTELEERYGLVFNCHRKCDEKRAIDLAASLAATSGASRREWRAKAARLVAEHIDVADYIVNAILDCGNAAGDLRTHPLQQA